MFFQRTLSSIFLIVIIVFTVSLSKGSLAFLTLLVSNVIIAFGLLDFMYITNRDGSKLLRTCGVISGIILNTFLFFRYFFGQSGSEILVAGTVIILFSMFVIQIIRQETKFTIHGICTTLTGIIYVVWLFSYLIKIIYISHVDGRWLILVLAAITKSGDIFAYLIGSNFGKHKLIPKISPKKTVEGSIGGIIGSVLVAVFIIKITPVPVKMSGHSWILGIILGITGQLGDLIESMLKRNGSVKDSGQYIPGMGGVLDLLDSILFNAPIMYFYLYYILDMS